MLGIPDTPFNELLRFDIDTSTVQFGRFIDHKLSETDDKLKPKHTIDKLLNTKSEPKTIQHNKAVKLPPRDENYTPPPPPNIMLNPRKRMP